MTHTLPYKRNCRCFKDGHYSEGGRSQYILDPNYAEIPEHYIRAFLLIQKDLINLFDYIEPSDINSSTFSFRIHELLLRTCVEIEANFMAILKENAYSSSKRNWDIEDYKKLNKSHRLSSYKVKVPYWKGIDNVRQPFKSFATYDSPEWYRAYNKIKHERSDKFDKANFNNLIDSVSGLVVVLSSQFYTWDFSPSDDHLSVRISGRNNDNMESAIGGYFRIQFPTDWPDEDKYDFFWSQIKSKENKFAKLFNDLM